jgi:hypothetical protein
MVVVAFQSCRLEPVDLPARLHNFAVVMLSPRRDVGRNGLGGGTWVAGEGRLLSDPLE